MKKREWTNEEDEILNELYASTPNEKLVKMLNRSRAAIVNRSNLLFLTKAPVEYAYYKGDKHVITGTIAEVAEYVGVAKKTIGNYASPAHKRRVEECKNPENRIVVERLD